MRVCVPSQKKDFPYCMEPLLFGRSLDNIPKGPARKSASLQVIMQQLLENLKACHAVGELAWASVTSNTHAVFLPAHAITMCVLVSQASCTGMSSPRTASSPPPRVA